MKFIEIFLKNFIFPITCNQNQNEALKTGENIVIIVTLKCMIFPIFYFSRMNFEEPQGSFLNHFQNLVFDDRKENGDASDKADIYRNLMAQISFAANSNL